MKLNQIYAPCAHGCNYTILDLSMETSDSKPTEKPAGKPTEVVPPPTTTAQQPATSQAASPPSPPPSQSGAKTEAKVSTSNDAPDTSTPPFSPSSETPVLEKEQEEFEGTVDVNDDLPSEKDLKKVEDLLVLDAQGQSRPFKELYQAPLVAPRQLIIFIRHFFCGVSCALVEQRS